MQTEDTLCYRKYKTEQNKKLELGTGSSVPKAGLESFLSWMRGAAVSSETWEAPPAALALSSNISSGVSSCRARLCTLDVQVQQLHFTASELTEMRL